MTKTWLHRILKGTLGGILVGLVLGGFEVVLALRGPVSQQIHALDRLKLWGYGAGTAAVVAGLLGLVLATAIGAFAGHDPETEALAMDTDRDPWHPWMPWVLGGAAMGTALLQVLPIAMAYPPGARARGVLVIGLALVLSAASAILLRFFTHRLDHTGRGMGLAVLGLPTLVVIGMSLAVSAPMAGGKGKAARAREGLPNVLLISVDGLRRDHVGPGARVRTPNLDWLGRQGVWFEEASTPSTAEGPPLSALLTGYHPLSTGFLADGQRLPRKLPVKHKPIRTLAETLRSEGYATAAFVSSVALDGGETGLDRGFSVYDDGIGERLPGQRELGIPRVLGWLARAGGDLPEGPKLLRPSAATLIRFERWLAYHYRENWFSWVHLSDPRMPFLAAEVAPDRLRDPVPGEEGRAYSSRVTQQDEILGEMVAALDADGLMDRTVIVIVGSRGWAPGGGRPTVAEPWSQVPVLMFGPGIAEGQRVDHTIRLQDLPPSILSAVGLRKPKMGDGVSLISTFAGGRSLDRLQAIVVSPPRRDGKTAIALRTPEWKYVREPKGTSALYDPIADPEELKDLSESKASLAGKASEALDELLGGFVPKVRRPALGPDREAEIRGLGAQR
jgi:hypothetical protein